jgi:uncharacterized delta-60 repeat protein/uncharacterized repeat protein (TIGR01451 family)
MSMASRVWVRLATAAPIAALMLAVAAPGASAATLTADYRFQNTRSSSVGSPPDLVDIGPGTNSFQTDTVDGQAQTVLAFPMGNGLSLSPTTGVVPNGTYSIVARFRFDTVSGFRRILDFKNATSDNGLYAESGNLRFFPYAGGSGTPITANTYVQVALTRDSAGTMVGYVNGVQQFSVSDAANQFGVISSANSLRFFRDDGAEHSAGRVTRIRLFDAALTAAEVANLEPPPPPPPPLAPGDLDPTFDGDGKVTTDFAGGGDRAFAVVRQPDGKLVTAGRFSQPGVVAAGWALARYNADGGLDTSFGSGGKVTTEFGADGEAFALVLQPDGKLVAAGTARVGVSPTAFGLARYNPDGSLDPTFGSAGKVTTEFGAGTGGPGARALVLQPDGKLVAAGTVFVNDGTSNNFALARYNPDGSLDATFGSGGRVITNFAGSSIDAAFALVLQPDDKLVAAGETHSPQRFALARYNPNGSLDATFGSGGKVTTDVGGSQDTNEALALVLQPDGKIVAAGRALVGGVTVDFALARYHPDGSLDATFDGDGRVTTNFVGLDNDQVFGLVLQPDGKLVAAGSTGTGSTSDFALARYNADGGLDTTFGSGGKVTTNFGGTSLDTAFALVLQPDGKLVAAGEAAGASGTGDFALARYDGGPVAVPTTSTLTSAPNPSTFGESVTFTDTVCGGVAGSEPTGTVTFREGSSTLGTGTLAVGGGTGCAQATFATSSLSVGSHTITAEYPGDAGHTASTSNAVTQVVNKIPTTSTLTSSPNPSTFGESVTFTDTVCGGTAGNEPSGTVTFEEGATTLGTGALGPGGGTGCSQATFTTDALSVGSHDVTADYPGDTTHAASTPNTVTQVVNAIPTTSTLTSAPNPSTFGDSVTFTDTVCGGAAGNEPSGIVTFEEGATTLGTGTLAPGGGTGCSQATFATASLPLGSHDVVADYPGDATHQASTSTVTQVVHKIATTSTLTSSPNPSTFSQSVTFRDTVCGGTAGNEPTGTVTFREGATMLGTASLAPAGSTGCAQATFATGSLSAGSHDVTADYPGDGTHEPSASNTLTQFVNKSPTTSTLTSSSPSVFGQNESFRDTVCGSSEGDEPTGTVTFYEGNTVLGTAPLETGRIGRVGCTDAIFDTILPVGSHDVIAEYPGDANHTGSVSNTVTHVVIPASTTSTLTTSQNPSTVGQQVTFTDTVCRGPSGYEPTGTVTFREGTATLGTGALAPGGPSGCSEAVFSTASLSAGNHDVTADYPGDTNFEASSSNTITQEVNKIATTSTLVSSPNPSTAGQDVSFTDTVCGSSADEPTGTVTFEEGATTLGTGTLAPGGGTGCAQATFATSSLAVGSHDLTADYPGDATHAPSTSNTVTQVVNKITTTSTLTSSPNPSEHGQSVTFTDTVCGGAAGNEPTGTVSFREGTTTLGTGTLAPGGGTGCSQASFATASLSVGSHDVTAEYPGDATHAGSTSNTVMQVVNAVADLSISKADSPDPVNNGQTLTYTLSVANAGPDPASGVVVTDSLPATVTFGSASASQGTCTQASGMVSCALGSMASGGTATVTITVTPTASGTITNTATVFGNETDPDPADNTDTETTTVDPVADLSIAKSCSPDRVVPGKTVRCTLTVHNAGPDGAQQVVVTDDLPEVVTVVGTPTGAGFACTTQAPDPEITCTRATLAAGATATITYTVRVSEDLGPETTFTNTARVTSSTFDPDPTDNTATETTSTPTCTIDRRTAGSPQVIMGTAGNDVICGSAFGDVIRGGGGNDVIFALGGDDIVFGEAGNDSVFGGAGNDTIDGGDGNDSAYGGAGNDTLSGGNGNDTLSGGAGSDTGVGGSGTDSCATEVRSGCES